MGLHLGVALAVFSHRDAPPRLETAPAPVMVTLFRPIQPPEPPGGGGAAAPSDAPVPTPPAAAPTPAPAPVRTRVPVRPVAAPVPPEVVAATAPVEIVAVTVGEAELAGAGRAGSGTGSGAGAGSGMGQGLGQGQSPGCDMLQRIQAALRSDPEVSAAIAQAHRAQLAGRTLLVWNGDWTPYPGQSGKGLAGVRQAIAVEVAFAPEACRLQPMHGLALLTLADAPGAPRVALGAGRWRWSDLTRR